MARLRHPYIAGVWDFDPGPPAFFVMEYYCRNLGDLIGETHDLYAPTRALHPPRACRYIRQTLSGLARLHHAGVVHRDIKPFNLLITDEDRIKIADFGLSKRRGEHFDAGRIHVGSPFYAAPEQEIDPESVGPAADLYSAAASLYRLTTGRPPVDGPTPPPNSNPDPPQGFDDFFFRAMSSSPADRFESAAAMSRALDEAEAAWGAHWEKTCRLASPPPAKPSDPPAALRARPLKVRPANAAATFGLDDLWRPHPPKTARFEDLGDGTVLDADRGLVWQQSGSEFGLFYGEARQYVDRLNQTAFAGASHWRLPTIDELTTLLPPADAPGGRCLPPPFDPRLQNLWSRDARSVMAAWYANTDLGFVGWQDHTCRFFARAVRTR
jgi:serine/threonine-protein kinase